MLSSEFDGEQEGINCKTLLECAGIVGEGRTEYHMYDAELLQVDKYTSKKDGSCRIVISWVDDLCISREI